MQNKPSRNLDTQFLGAFEPTPDVVLELLDDVNEDDASGYTKVRTPPPHVQLKRDQQRFSADRTLAEEDENEAVREEFLRGNGKTFCRTDNRNLHYYAGLVAEHGLYVSALVRHLVMAMRQKVKKHGWKCAVEWDPVELFAQHLGLSLRQTKRIIAKAVAAGFIKTQRTARGLSFMLADRTLLARTDGRHVSKSLMRFLSLTEATLYTLVFLHSRGIPGDSDYPPGKGYACTYRGVARFLPWTDHHGARTAFGRLVKKGVLERSKAKCNPFSFRWEVPQELCRLTADQLASLFCQQKWGEQDGTAVNKMALHPEQDGTMGEQDGPSITQEIAEHRIIAASQSEAELADAPAAPSRPLAGPSGAPARQRHDSATSSLSLGEVIRQTIRKEVQEAFQELARQLQR